MRLVHILDSLSLSLAVADVTTAVDIYSFGMCALEVTATSLSSY